MTDKQIIENKNGFYCIEPCSEIKQLKEQLKAKQQECEQLKITIEENSYRYAELDADFEQSKKECEELKDKLNCCFCNPHVESNDIEKQRKCIEVTECFRRQLDQLKKELASTKGLLTTSNKSLSEALTELDQLKAEKEHLSEKEEEAKHYLEEAEKFKNCLSEIKSLCYEQDLNEDFFACEVLQKINECEVINE